MKKLSVKVLGGFIFLGIILFLNNSHALAFDKTVVVNEIMWRGSSIVCGDKTCTMTSDEWVELKNTSDKVVDLSGWKLYDEVSGKAQVTISDGQIAPDGYFLISNNAKDYKFSAGESILNIDPDVIESAVSLSNTKFKMSLQDNLSQTIDTAGDGGEPFYGENEGQIASMQRTDYLADGDLKSAWSVSATRKNLDEGVLNFATPENSGRPKIDTLSFSPNNFQINSNFALEITSKVSDPNDDLDKIKIKITSSDQPKTEKDFDISTTYFDFGPLDFCPTVSIYFYDKTGLFVKQNLDIVCFQKTHDIRFSEILPHPKNIDWNKDGVINSSDEWIELENIGNQNIDLAGWKIQDKSGKTYLFDSKINPGFLVFFGLQTKIILNDDGETLYLIDPSNEIIDTITIPNSSSKLDMSFARQPDGWQWTLITSLGSENPKIIISESPVETKPVLTPSSNTKNIDRPMEGLESQPVEQTETIIIKKTVKITHKKLPSKVTSIKLSKISIDPMVLGSSTYREPSYALKPRQILLYLIGLIIIISQIASYGFYRQKPK
ncbi:MAG: lamin tail domain-containing protein [Candidatus Berkelbacteria bacterium]|nr:lamin tail domain-containing protein [Candidatus Berkelbacteria bacterium]